MRILYLDCGMGAAGDMLSAALADLFDDKQIIIDELNGLGIPNVEYSLRRDKKCGICGSKMIVKVSGEEEFCHDHHDHDDHHHDDHSEHHHHHRDFNGIKAIVEAVNASKKVKDRVIAAYLLIAQAESKAHGESVEKVHFHEVGAFDAVADVAAVCYLMEKLSPDKVLCSPVRVGFGEVRCAHGVLPVPAPATAHILTGVPVYAGDIEGETCTPTGAALIKTFADGFSELPLMKTERIGYGMGTKDFPRANVVRAILGTTEGEADESIVQLDFNVDDMTAEELSFACEMLYDLGAKEVFCQSAVMKKGRLGSLVTVLCERTTVDGLVKGIFTHTSTIGVRRSDKKRYVLSRSVDTIATRYGDIRRKTSVGYGTKKIKYEFDDLKAAALKNGVPIKEIENNIDKDEQ